MTTETYADKINKLLAKAESTNSPEEAEALVAKAQEWMTKYAIDEALLAKSRGTEAAQKIVQEDLKFEGNMAHAYARIASAIAEANDCRVLWTKGEYRAGQAYSMTKYNRTIHVIGFEGDVERVKVLNSSLQIQGMGALGKWWKDSSDVYKWCSRSVRDRERRTFLESFGHGLKVQLTVARGAAVKAGEEERGSTGSVALVIRSKEERVGDWIDEKYGKLTSVRTRHYGGSGMAQKAGKEAGMRADAGGNGRVGGVAAGELNR